MFSYDVTVIGAGPAGLAAALAAHRNGAKTLIVERENKPGGILKQCIHDGFGLIRFKEKLSGPEYAGRFVELVKAENIPMFTSTFVAGIEKSDGHYKLTLINPVNGVFTVHTNCLVLANGCRERTSKQVFIHGTRPAGIYTAGTAQYFVNIMGYLPCKRCVVLGSGDIGLIMARRLTLEGAEVLGVYEAKPSPSGLSRNIAQCLNDYHIPLHLSRTVTKVFGDDRVEGVEICSVNEEMRPISGMEEHLTCDGVILSVGLIPENELAEALGIPIDNRTKGPFVDQNFMTLIDGVFSCGNALHVNDLVDYVSESGELAGNYAAQYSREKKERRLIKITSQPEDFMYSVPQYFDINAPDKKMTAYFRSKKTEENVRVQAKHISDIIFNKKYISLKPPEMERIAFSLKSDSSGPNDTIEIKMLKGSDAI